MNMVLSVGAFASYFQEHAKCDDEEVDNAIRVLIEETSWSPEFRWANMVSWTRYRALAHDIQVCLFGEEIYLVYWPELEEEG